MLLSLYSKRASYAVWLLSATGASVIMLSALFLADPGLTLHYLAGVSLIALLSGPAIVGHMKESRKQRIDNALPLLLDDVGESQETGMTLVQALREVSKRNYGPISGELKRLVAQLSWGVEFRLAFETFARRIGTPMTERVSVLITESVALGGDLKTAFRSTAEFLRKLLDLRQERQSQLRPFFMVIYVSNVVFDVIIIILYQNFILPLAPPPALEGDAGVSFLRMPLTLGEYRSILFDMTVIEAVFGGLAAGKFGSGRALSGLKHSVIMISIAVVAFWLFF